MKIVKIAIFAAALLSPATTFANYEPMGVDGKQGLTTTITRETEGYPNMAAHGSCVFRSRAVNDVHGKFIGYQTIQVCS